MSHEHGKIELSIGNAGAKISVVDEGCGPVIRIETAAFDNLRLNLGIRTNKRSLATLAEMFATVAREEYSPAGYYAAQWFSEEERAEACDGPHSLAGATLSGPDSGPTVTERKLCGCKAYSDGGRAFCGEDHARTWVASAKAAPTYGA